MRTSKNILVILLITLAFAACKNVTQPEVKTVATSTEIDIDIDTTPPCFLFPADRADICRQLATKVSRQFGGAGLWGLFLKFIFDIEIANTLPPDPEDVDPPPSFFFNHFNFLLN